jgi:hypothetical protein
MPKKCIICGVEAKFCIKDTSDFYCEECAKENFSEIELLEKLEDRAKKLKKLIDKQLPPEEDLETTEEE